MTEQEKYTLTCENVFGDEPLYAGRLLERAARHWPKRTALICQGVQLTYAELFKQALSISAQLEKAGIGPGKRVMLLYENALNFYRAYHAVWQVGAVIVPVNTMLHPNELALIITNAQPDGLIISSTLHEKYKSVISTISYVITSVDLERYIQQTAKTVNLQNLTPNDLCVILYTSGTTGTPKGVMLSSENILVNCIQASARFTVYPTDSFLAVLPLFHSYTQNSCVWFSTLFGLKTIIVPKIERTLLQEALNYNPTVIFGIPQLYGLFCLLKTLEFPRVRYFMSGGDLLPNKTRMLFELIYRRKICTGYGLTEASPFISIDIDDTLKAPDTVGQPFVGIECSLRDEDSVELPSDATGILWIKGKNVMLGYYNAPELTASVLVDGWLNTGDIAYFNESGKIVLYGRQKDLIKSKGVKVYPQEIENVLLSHPLVTAAAVIGLQTEEEEIPVAYVSVRTQAMADTALFEKELRELCASHLASYEIPRRFYIRHTLPMTATGKVDKKALKRELAVDGH